MRRKACPNSTGLSRSRLLSTSNDSFNNKVYGCKGLIGCNAGRWMEIYFSKQCDIMPTTGRLHLSDNFTCREVYQAYKNDMLLESVPYIQYRILIDYGGCRLTMWSYRVKSQWVFVLYVQV